MPGAGRTFLSPKTAGVVSPETAIWGRHAETLLPCHHPRRRRGNADEVRHAQGAAQGGRAAHARPRSEGGRGRRRRRHRCGRRTGRGGGSRLPRTGSAGCHDLRAGAEAGHRPCGAGGEESHLARRRRRAGALRRHAAGERPDAETTARGARPRRPYRGAGFPSARSLRLRPADRRGPAARRHPRAEGRHGAREGHPPM